MILISLGFNNLNSWGVVMAKDAAPISLLGLSPAPFMVLDRHRARPGILYLVALSPETEQDAAAVAAGAGFFA